MLLFKFDRYFKKKTFYGAYIYTNIVITTMMFFQMHRNMENNKN